MPKVTKLVVWGHEICFMAHYWLHFVVECLLVGVSPSSDTNVHNRGKFKHAYRSFVHFVIVDSRFKATVC